MDAVFSFILIVLLSPLYVFIAILVRIKLGAPVLFKQERPGKKEKIFLMYKFRTMSDIYDSENRLLPDTERLSSFGKWLRRTSLDELPELINILKGEMSFIGPRPLAVVYLPYYTNEERERHFVTPGLTGLAQIKGRNSIKWEEKFSYDIQYVKNMSFWNDINILFNTFIIVIKKEGIGQAEECPVSLHIERGANEEG